MREYRTDLHIHTLLSACAEVEMIPPLIVDEALHKGLDIIAITDHNTTRNAAAVMQAAAGSGLTVLPGMELQTQEEVEIICLFDSLARAEMWEEQVETWLPPLENDPERFGPQYIVDAEGDFVAEDTQMRQLPAEIGLETAARAARELGGLVFPAHIERPAKGLMVILGLWPPDLAADAAEVSFNMRPSEARATYPHLPDIPIITNSDAHWLNWIGKVLTVFVMQRPSIDEMRKALRGEGERRVYVP
ncbi:MAG: PHP domain-containing protein [Anaerolineales bacterium]